MEPSSTFGDVAIAAIGAKFCLLNRTDRVARLASRRVNSGGSGLYRHYQCTLPLRTQPSLLPASNPTVAKTCTVRCDAATSLGNEIG